MKRKLKCIAGVLPCGCVSLIMVVESSDGKYKASVKDMADFYASVNRQTTRKRNPLKLEVKEIVGRDFQMGCDVCK